MTKLDASVPGAAAPRWEPLQRVGRWLAGAVAGSWRAGLFKAGFYSLLGTVAQLMTGVISVKVIAVVVGPGGLAILAQLRNLLGVAGTLSTAGIASGVVKYVAEYQTDVHARRRVIATALRITLACGAATALTLVALSGPLSGWLLGRASYRPVLALCGATITLAALNSLFMAVMNGYRQVRRLTLVSILTSAVGAALMSAFTIIWGLWGALIALPLTSLAGFTIIALFSVRRNWISWQEICGAADRLSARKLGRFSSMGLTAALFGPVTAILMRRYLIYSFGLDGAGYWQAVSRISDLYLSVVTGTLGLYYLPRLSQITDSRELRLEMGRAATIVLPVVVASALCIYLGRESIITVLFAPSFRPMDELFAFQLVGDVLKIASWIFAYLMVARAFVRMFILTEVGFSGLLLVLTVAMTHEFGLIGVTYAFAANYALYFFTITFLLRGELFSATSRPPAAAHNL